MACGASGVAGSACSTGDARSLRHGVALHVACIRMARSAVDAHSVVSQLDRCPVCLFVLLGLRRSTARSSCAAVWYIVGSVSTLSASEALGASLCYETDLAFSARTASCGAEGQYYGRGTTYPRRSCWCQCRSHSTATVERAAACKHTVNSWLQSAV